MTEQLPPQPEPLATPEIVKYTPEAQSPDVDRAMRQLGHKTLHAVQTLAPAEGVAETSDTYSGVSKNILEHPMFVAWLEGYAHPEDTRRDIIVAATQRALSSESVKSINEVVCHELQTIPSDIEHTRTILRQIQHSFDDIRHDIKVTSSRLKEMVEAIKQGNNIDNEATIAKINEIQERAESWGIKVGRQSQGEDFSGFTRRVIDKSNAIMHHAKITGSSLRHAVVKVQHDTEKYELPESAHEEIDNAQEDTAEEFTEKAARDEERAHGLIDALYGDATNLVISTQEIAEKAGMIELAQRFPQLTHELRNDLNALERGIRSKNVRDIEILKSDIIARLVVLEDQARNVQTAAVDGLDELTKVENSIHIITSSMQSV